MINRRPIQLELTVGILLEKFNEYWKEKEKVNTPNNHDEIYNTVKHFVCIQPMKRKYQKT